MSLFESVRAHLTDLAPEEIASAALLIIAAVAVALQPTTVTRLFEAPYATVPPQRIAFVNSGDPGTIAFDAIVETVVVEPSPRITICFESRLDALLWVIRTGGGVSLSCQR
jgi:hypothetical protein